MLGSLLLFVAFETNYSSDYENSKSSNDDSDDRACTETGRRVVDELKVGHAISVRRIVSNSEELLTFERRLTTGAQWDVLVVTCRGVTKSERAAACADRERTDHVGNAGVVALHCRVVSQCSLSDAYCLVGPDLWDGGVKAVDR